VSFQSEVPTNDGWKDIVNPSVSHHRGWPNMPLNLPPLVNPNVHISYVDSPVQASNAIKSLKTEVPQPMQDKGK
jgi:hypothetical protein